MHIESFSFSELEKQLEELSSDVEKIEFISNEVKKCKVAINDVEYEAENFETMEIRLTLKAARPETPLVEVLNNDRRIRRTATRKIMKLCARKLCRELYNYLKRAEVLLAHHKTKIEARSNWNNYLVNDKYLFSETGQKELVIWLLGKDKLLRLFVYLYREGFITEYSKEEILVHYADEKQRPFYQSKGYSIKIRWRKSDDSFSIFISELAKRGMIDNKNIDRIFEKHFVNRNGNSFKDLAQKRYNTKNFTKTGNIISKILDSIA